jgi:hypothetical protein
MTSTFIAVYRVRSDSFQKGLKEIKSNNSAKFDATAKTWTVEISNDNRILKGNEEWYGLELLSVNGIKICKQAEEKEMAAATDTVRIARSYNEEDAEDFGYINRGDIKRMARQNWAENYNG